MDSVSSWSTKPYGALGALELARALGLSATTAAILGKRGYSDLRAARDFLAADEDHDPRHLPCIEAACSLILKHIDEESPIVVFGDYDVDGVCATAIALSGLRAVGARPSWRLPSRDEGYGLSEAAVRELAAAGAGLIVTVDCGVTAVGEIALAKELGVDVIVTDHHKPGKPLPDCPVVHPALGHYPFDSLCGAGVAYKLSRALRSAAGVDPKEADADLDLAGLATVCDMVPLVGENRRIARAGLVALARTERPGLRALMAVAELDPGDVDAQAASFRLGPRINAAGRLARADAALELLTTEDETRARQVAKELDGLNHDRRETERRITHEADALCAPQLAQAALVVAAEEWHPGVVGIVASRLVERYRRPAVVIALDGDGGRGSGRSIPRYDLHSGLAAVSEDLIGFGGHAMAAGLDIAADHVGAFRAALAAHAGAALTPADLRRTERVDAVVGAGALTLDLAEELEKLGPFGVGNPAPRLLVPAARIEHVTAMGKENEHARFSLASGGARARGVAFRTSQKALGEAGSAPQDAAVTLERNSWNGAVEARVVLGSLCPTRAGKVSTARRGDLAAHVAAEFECDPSHWGLEPGTPTRAVVDRRGEGFGGTAGDLLTSGEPVVVLVTDLARRREALERLIAGLGAGALAVAEWEGIGRDPGAFATTTHLLALDPPPVAEGIAALAAFPGPGAVHLAWGEAERAFTLAAWSHRLALRPALAEVWRSLREGERLTGADLDRALGGGGRHPRDLATQARIVRVLCELDLAVWTTDDGPPVLARGPGGRTDLDRSVAQRGYAARLAAARQWLEGSEGARLPLAS